MGRKKIISPTLDEQKEERLRPSRLLGYDRNSLGLYALQKGMLEVAESQFRRAAYLNPYQPLFLQHLAWSLYKQARYAEANKCIIEVLGQLPDDKDSVYIRSKIEGKMVPTLSQKDG